MSVPEDDTKQRALKREWAAARIVVIGGFIVAIGVAGYFVWKARQERIAQEPVVHATVVPPKIDAKTLQQLELALCTVELIHAKDLGMVPSYGELASGRLWHGTVPNRFICEAKTHLTNYFISADLLCSKISDPRCLSVYRVALRDGTLIYSRPQ